MNQLQRFRVAATRENEGMNLNRVDDFLEFIAAKLSPEDFVEAVDLLHAAVDAHHAAHRHVRRKAVSG